MSERIPPLGSMRDRIELYRKFSVIGADGGIAVNFVPITKVWARVTMRSGRVMALDEARESQVSHLVVLRFRKDVEPGDRILYRDQWLDIETVADLNGRRAYITCACTQTQIVG